MLADKAQITKLCRGGVKKGWHLFRRNASLFIFKIFVSLSLEPKIKKS